PSVVQAAPAAVWQASAASSHVLSHSAPPVHGSPLCVHMPSLHVSVPSQKTPSSQEAVFGVCAQVPEPLQASSVQTLPSVVQAVPAAVWQSLAASSHVLSHSGPPAHGSPLCVHMPSLHVSGASQKTPSSPGPVFGTCGQTRRGPLQASSVQTLPSVVQAVPAAVWQSLAASSHVLSHSGPPAHGSPLCVHMPSLHVSGPLQKTPSSQGSVFGTWRQPSCGSQLS